MNHDDASRPRTRMLPPAPYAAALVAGWWLDRSVLPLPAGLGRGPIAIGWLFVILGLALVGWTLATFRRHRTTVNPYKGATMLCTSGPFGWSRNPIYLSDWIIFFGLCLLLNTLWPAFFSPVIWAILRYGVIAHEERHLEARFGDAYRRYVNHVGRWFGVRFE